MAFKFQKRLSHPVEATYFGDFRIDEFRLAVILNSRQSKTPAGKDPWIINTIKAARWAIDNKYVLITSLGMNTWELICWACGNYGGRQMIIFPTASLKNIEKNITKIEDDFGLDRRKTSWLFFKATEKARSPKTDWPRRDLLAVSFANVIIPVSIRPAGNLEAKIQNQTKDNKREIVGYFSVPYADRAKQYGPAITVEDLSHKIVNMPWDYITHWTRTCYGPYPGEKAGIFYYRLVHSGDSYTNSALNTLKQIVLEKKIRGSSQKIRNGLNIVAFSGLHPKDIIPLMRWRARYVRWSFEPYGIAVSKKAASEVDIRPVIYGQPSLYDNLSQIDKPFFQNEGVNGGDWRPENEWRHIGNLDLTKLNQSDMMIIVSKPSEIDTIQWFTETKVISLT